MNFYFTSLNENLFQRFKLKRKTSGVNLLLFNLLLFNLLLLRVVLVKARVIKTEKAYAWATAADG